MEEDRHVKVVHGPQREVDPEAHRGQQYDMREARNRRSLDVVHGQLVVQGDPQNRVRVQRVAVPQAVHLQHVLGVGQVLAQDYDF